MKIKDIASKNGWDAIRLESYVRNHGYRMGGFIDATVDDKDIDRIVKGYSEIVVFQEAKKAAEAKEHEDNLRREEERRQREKIRQQAISNMLVTSGFNFDGYTVKKYSGYISGDDVIQIDRSKLFNNHGQLLTDSLVIIRTQALKELKEAAYDLGCNAVIGVDFDYMTFEPETISGGTHYYEPYVVCVTANGNAVVIEKN